MLYANVKVLSDYLPFIDSFLFVLLYGLLLNLNFGEDISIFREV